MAQLAAPYPSLGAGPGVCRLVFMTCRLIVRRCDHPSLYQAVASHLLAARRRPARDNRHVRINYDSDAEAAYIHLGDDPGAAHRTTTQAATPDGVDGFVALDWEDGRIVGIEILDASSRLSHDVLDEAEHIS